MEDSKDLQALACSQDFSELGELGNKEACAGTHTVDIPEMMQSALMSLLH
jgi:hypothetical protein